MRNSNKPKNLIYARLAGEEAPIPEQKKTTTKVNKNRILNELIGLKFKSTDNNVNRKIKKKK